MTLVPRTLAGRILLVLLVGLTLSHLIGLAIYSGERQFALAAQSGHDAAARIAAVVESVEQAAPADRPAVARSFWSPGFAVSWSETALVVRGDTGWRARWLSSAIVDRLDFLPVESIRLRLRRPPTTPGSALDGGPGWWGDGGHSRHMREMGMGRPPPGAMDHMARMWHQGAVLEASLGLSAGDWLNFAVLVPRGQPFWLGRFFLSILLMALAVTGLAIWAMRRATRPLAVFSEAAERLGTDVNVPPMPEEGPREVSRLARAFNDMQRRLKAFVEERTQMLAAVSHDLRTPITRLRLRADFVEDDDQRRKMLDDLDQMEAMIAAVLAFARDETLQEAPRPFDLAVLLRDLCDEAGDAGQRANYDGPEKLVYPGRPLALRRAFANLIDNAAKYGGRAGVSLTSTGDVLTVTIEDDGPGIPESQMESVFKPFHRLEGSRSRDTGGVGLGLASVRAIIKAHGGDVTLANRSEGGLRVEVSLPT